MTARGFQERESEEDSRYWERGARGEGGRGVSSNVWTRIGAEGGPRRSSVMVWRGG